MTQGKRGLSAAQETDRHMVPLEGGAVVAYDWSGRQGTYLHSLSVGGSRWDCPASPSALAPDADTG
jgi:hypothetical protein